MAKARAKAAVPKAVAVKKTSKKPAAKKTAAKKAPAEKGAKAVTPALVEHPEGMFARLAALRDEMDHLFDNMTRSFGFPELRMPTVGLPAPAGIVDVRFEISESDKAVDVTAELPGLGLDDINVTLSEGMLTVKGEKRDTREEKGKDSYVSERRYGSFSRSFRIPDSVDEDRIAASFDDGVLKISLPKHAKPKRRPKSIKVTKT